MQGGYLRLPRLRVPELQPAHKRLHGAKDGGHQREGLRTCKARSHIHSPEPPGMKRKQAGDMLPAQRSGRGSTGKLACRGGALAQLQQVNEGLVRAAATAPSTLLRLVGAEVRQQVE